MPYPLSKAQIRFQRIKRQERVAHIREAKEQMHDEFEMRRQAIQDAIVARLENSGQTINMTVVRNLATQQAVAERKEEMSEKRWNWKHGC
jgi:hypothetical protein